MPLVLASASPRRRELVGAIGLPFVVDPGEVDESPLPGESPWPMARRVAEAKALDVSRRRPADVVVGADTIVVADPWGRPEALGKPADAVEARAMLCRLAGCEHVVITGVALVWLQCGRTVVRSRVVETRVWFRPLSLTAIADYVASGEPMDKAGAYGIQGGAGAFVERIMGDYENVVGLSSPALAEMLAPLRGERLGGGATDG